MGDSRAGEEPGRPAFSIVIPVRDEAGNIGGLLEEVQGVLRNRSFETIVVDDGSRDGTHEALQSYLPRFSRLRVLRHLEASGQSAAIATGVRAAASDWIVTMDGDGQNDPADIAKLLERASGLDPAPAMVVGWRRGRKDPWPKRVASRVANAIYRGLLGDRTPDVGCGLKLFRRDTFLSLPSFDHMHRFLPALVGRNGGRIESVEVGHRPRRKGRSKYGVIDRLLSGTSDILGVKWLQTRAMTPRWVETGSDADAPVAPGSEKTRGAADRKLHPLATLLLLSLALFFVFGRLGALPLLDPDEGRNAAVGREMARSGEWLVPTYNGLAYLDKPAFYFKLVALSFQAFGVGEAAARLPSALFAAALLGVLYRFCGKEYGTTTAVLALAIVAAMPLFAAFAHIVIFDMALAFFVSLAILAGYRAEEHGGVRRRILYGLGAAAAGAATLTKGPIGFVIPTLVLLALAGLERRRGVVGAMLHPFALGTFLVLVVPWIVGVSLERPDFLYYGIVRESLERFTRPTLLRTGPFYYYVPVIASVCFGWSVLLPGAIRLAWRRRSHLARADRLFVAWALTVVLFFSLSQSKLPGYVLTAVVACGVLIARLFSRALAEPGGAAAGIVFRGAFALAAVSLPSAAWLAWELRAPLGSAVSFGVFDLPEATLRDFAQPLIFTLMAVSGVALLGWRTRSAATVLGAFFLFPLSLFTVSFGPLERYAADNSSAELAREVRSLPLRTAVVCVRCFPTGLPFYLDRTVFLVSDDGTETTSNYIPYALSREPVSPAQIIPISRLRPWLRSRRRPILLLASSEGASILDSMAGERASVQPFSRGFRGLYLRRRSRHDR